MKPILPALFLVLSLIAVTGEADASAGRLVFFGDSLTAGHAILPDETYPARIQEKIDERGWPFQTVNAGVSGETSAGGLRRIDWILRRPVAIFVLELGANDGLRGLDPAETKKNLQAILDKVAAASPEAKLVVAGMRVPPNMGAAYADEFASIFPALAKENDAALIPFLLEGVGGVRNLNLPDGVHPNPDGHRILAETVWETLEPLLLETLESER